MQVEQIPLFEFHDFHGGRLDVQVENAATQTRVQNFDVSKTDLSIIEIGESHLLIGLPDKSCAKGHNLLLQAKAYNRLHPQKFFAVEATGKVEEMGSLGPGKDWVSLNLVQFEKANWENLKNYYLKCQREAFEKIWQGGGWIHHKTKTSQQPLTPEENEKAKNFLKGQRVLIADPSLNSVRGTLRLLERAGIDGKSVEKAHTLKDAQTQIQKLKPNVFVVSALFLESLMKFFRERVPSIENTLVIVTSEDLSRKVVSACVETDVDLILYQPFQRGNSEKILLEAVVRKMNLSEYIHRIDQGRGLMQKGDLENAAQKFKSAQDLQADLPAAWGYLGEVSRLLEHNDSAERSFNKSLELHPCYYRGLVNRYESALAKGGHQKSAEAVAQLIRHYPHHPQRLATYARLSLMSDPALDIQKFFQEIVSVPLTETKTLQYLSSAALVFGRYFLKLQEFSLALQLFQRAVMTTDGVIEHYRQIITSLCEANQRDAAKKFLIPVKEMREAVTTYLALELLISFWEVPPQQSLDKAKLLLQKGVQDPAIYEVMVRCLKKMNLLAEASEAAREAVKRYPLIAITLKDILSAQ